MITSYLLNITENTFIYVKNIQNNVFIKNGWIESRNIKFKVKNGKIYVEFSNRYLKINNKEMKYVKI